MRHPRSERGTATMEVVIIAPFVLAMLLLIMGFARYSLAENVIDQAARDGARAATASKERAKVDEAVNQAVTEALEGAPDSCRQTASVAPPEMSDTAFEVADPDNPTAVDTISVTVSCQLRLSDLAPVFFGKPVPMERTFISPIDRYRSDR